MFIIWAVVGIYLFDYNLDRWFGKDVPWYLDVIGGALTGWLNLVAAFIAYCHGGPFPIFK